MLIYQPKNYGDWLQQNPNGTYLEYLEEQVRWIELELQFPNLISKERISYLEEERQYFLAKINNLKWNKIKLENLNSGKELWQK